jgi:hypothetical protein
MVGGGAEAGPGIPPMVGSLKMNTALEYSTRVVQEGDTSSYIYAGGGSTRWQHKGRASVMRPSMYEYVHCKIVHTTICTVVAEIIE